MPTCTPRLVRQISRKLPPYGISAGRSALRIFTGALLLSAVSAVQAADPADAPTLLQDDQVTPANIPSAEAPPLASGAPEEGSIDLAANSLLRRLSSDECCPIFDGCCPDGAACCPIVDNDLCCFATGCDGCDAVCCRSDANFYIGVEFGVLKPEVDRLRVPGTANPQTLKPDHSYEFAPRFFGGFQTCEGWGGQVSYWTLETGANGTNLPNVFHDLDLQTVDVDFTKTFELGDLSLQVGAGGRWGEIESNYFSIVNPNQRLTTDFEGTGPTAVLNIRRPLGSGGWAVVGEGRASFLYGDTSVDAPLVPGLTIGDEWVDIWEGRVGIEWNGPTASGNAQFFARALFEGQYWNVPSVGPAGSPDLNFLGPTVSVGFVF